MNENSLFKNRIVVYLVALVVFLFFVNDYALISSDKIAIVVALGIDKSEDGVEVSAEIAIPPTPSDEKSSEGSQTLLTAKGATVSEAISNLFLRTGWYPKLNYCNLILLSEEIAKEGAMKTLEYFVRSEKIMDSALILIARGSTAKKILETSTPLDNVSSFSLQKIAFQRYLDYSDVSASNLKDFAKNYFAEDKSNVVAAVSIHELDASSSEAEKQQTLQDKFALFDMTNSALFADDKLSGFIGPEETKALNYIRKDVNGSTLEIDDVVIPYLNDKPTGFSLKIAKHKKEITPKLENGELMLDVYVELTVTIEDSSDEDKSIMGLASTREVPAELLAATALSINEDFNTLFAKLNAANCDAIGVGKSVNDKNHRQWDEYITADNFLTYPSEIKYHSVVTVKSLIKEIGNEKNE